MPGIVGLITQMPRERAEPQLLQMLEVLRHESFYVTGTWVDESLGIYVGWIARSESVSGQMPICSEQGNVVLAFAGEDYPEPGVISRLKCRGHQVSEVGFDYLVHLYEENQGAFPAGLNGRFQGLLTDRRNGTAILFNDRYGMHRLYYHESKEAFYFGAEAKAILAVRPELRRPDPRGLGELVSCGCVLENRTVFKDIQVLPAGSAWTFRAQTLEGKNSYFQPRAWEEQPALEPEPYYQELREVFSRNLPRYFNGRARIAMSLTGGLDTRMIMAWQKPSAGSLPCYTFGGTTRECRDVIVAQQVARACGQSHEVIRAGNDFLACFPYYAERTVYLTDGCTGVNFAPVLYVSEKARKTGSVRMTGNYGDQILRQLRAFGPDEPAPGLFSPDFLGNIHDAVLTYTGLLQMHPLSFAAFCQAPWHYYGLQALEHTQLTVRSPYMDNDLVQTSFRAPQSACRNNDLRLRLISDGSRELGRIRTDLGFGGRPGIAGTANRKLNEFTMRAEYAYDYGMPQWMAQIDHFFAPLHLERLFLGRHKYYHFRVWYRDALAAYVREILLDPQTLARPYLDRKGLEGLVQGHLDGSRNYTREIHKVLTLEHLHRIFFESR